MYRDHTVSVVVPAYNEERFVGDVIRDLPAFVDRAYVIDDRSTDGTWVEILDAAEDDARSNRSREPFDGDEQAVADDRDDRQAVADGGVSTTLAERATVHEPVGRIVPIQHHENRGAGGAIKTGYLASRAEGNDVTVTVDGDGQMDLSLMPNLLDPIVDETADYAKGNRLLYDDYKSEMPPFRLVGNSILSLLTKIASGYWKTSDPQNGYTAISRDALEAVDVESMYEYYGYCNDLLVKLNAHSVRIADVPIPSLYGDEESTITYRRYIPKVSGMLLRNFLWRLKVRYLLFDFHPVALFYLFGTATSALGVLGAIWSVVSWKRLGRSLFVRATLSALMFITGSLFLLFAMLFDMQANEDLEEVIRE